VVNAAYQAENYPQAYLKGHSSDVIIIEVSLDGRLMATCESGEKARMFLWDLQEGKRLAVLQPHAERCFC
jgi:WD40 repeat protein